MRYIIILSLLWAVFPSCKEAQDKSTGDSDEAARANEVKERVDEQASDGRKVILFYGNSITAGYGLDLSEAFPAIVQERLDSLGYDYQVINAGLSGETTASGLSRIEWVLRTPVDIFVLELGGNDGLRGISLDETKRNLESILLKVKGEYPQVKIVVAGMQIPPNMGQEYTEEFRGIFPVLAEKHDAVLIPFLLEGVGGNPELNLPDGIHPTAEGHKIVAETVWEALKPLLVKKSI